MEGARPPRERDIPEGRLLKAGKTLDGFVPANARTCHDRKRCVVARVYWLETSMRESTSGSIEVPALDDWTPLS